MKVLVFTIMILTLSLKVSGIGKFDSLTKPIIEEGKRLYQSEMASWYGTDIFLEKYKEREKIGGYFSYTENEISKCVFFLKGESKKVIGTISFDSTYNTTTAKIDLNEREFTNEENDYYSLRESAIKIMREDTLFKVYQNTNLNLIPIISMGEKKVYFLTAPTKSGVIIFGNDYLLSFDKNNNLSSKKKLHNNIITINYPTRDSAGKEITESIHSHLPETSDFITSTDICTPMLYEKFANWKQHSVISPKYLSTWNCKSNKLMVITREALDKIYKTDEEMKKK